MLAQVLAGTLFLAMLILIVLDKYERHVIALAGAVLVMALVFGLAMHSGQAMVDTLNIQSIFYTGFWFGEASHAATGVNWSTVIFIAGMMVMVEGMGKAGFFQWLCLKLAKMVHYRIIPLLICFLCLSGVLAMFIDSITVILFLVAVTVELSRILQFNPVPVIVAEIFCANLGGAATMCGDPPNIIIGTSLGYSFFDFLNNTGVIVLICFIVTLIYFYLLLKKDLRASEAARDSGIKYPDPQDAISNQKAFMASFIIFGVTVLLLVTHAMTTISVASIGVFAAAASLVCVFVTAKRAGIADILRHVDYKTLLFFIGLFVVVGGLEQTKILAMIARFLGTVCGGDIGKMIVILIWISAIASAFVDNIPFAATMVPVIQSMAAAQGVSLDVLAWTLAMGTDVGGNATPIGASANIVGTSLSAKEGYPIGWGTYCKYAVPITILVIVLSMVWIMVRYV